MQICAGVPPSSDQFENMASASGGRIEAHCLELRLLSQGNITSVNRYGCQRPMSQGCWWLVSGSPGCPLGTDIMPGAARCALRAPVLSEKVCVCLALVLNIYVFVLTPVYDSVLSCSRVTCVSRLAEKQTIVQKTINKLQIRHFKCEKCV